MFTSFQKKKKKIKKNRRLGKDNLQLKGQKKILFVVRMQKSVSLSVIYDILIYKTLYKTNIKCSTLYADRNLSFSSLPDTVVPAKTTSTMDPLVTREQPVNGGESRIHHRQLTWVLENAKQLTLRLRRANPVVTVTVTPPCCDSRVILGCQEYCRNLQVAILKFSHMLLQSRSKRGQKLFFHANPFQLSIAVILTITLPGLSLCLLNRNTMYYTSTVPYSNEEG